MIKKKITRRKLRELALQILFASEFQKNKIDPINWEIVIELLEENYGEEKYEFSKDLYKGTLKNLLKIDSIIERSIINWEINRITIIDKNIIRLAIFEMYFSNEKTKLEIAINEAIELAKKFGNEDSSKFVNGVLSAVVKNKLYNEEFI